jgi:hypothetical protein
MSSPRIESESERVAASEVAPLALVDGVACPDDEDCSADGFDVRCCRRLASKAREELEGIGGAGDVIILRITLHSS